MTHVPSPDIVLYGGGFDPPHQGHLDCIRSVRRLFPKVRIEVLPALSPVYAGGELKAPRLSFDTRLELCRLAFEVDSGLTDVVTADVEAHLPSPNYTLNLIEQYNKSNIYNRIGLMVGLDQLQVFDKWHEPLKLLAMTDLLVVKRDDGSLVTCVADVIANRLGLDLSWVVQGKVALVKGETIGQRGCYIHILEDATTCVSSSQVRLLFGGREKVPHGWLTPSVEEALRRRHFIG